MLQAFLGRRTPAFRAGVLALGSLCVLGPSSLSLSCRSRASLSEPPQARAGSSSTASHALGDRADAVASADAWAVSGTKLGGRAGAQQLLNAARLRERIFRLDHREADALEGIDLYQQAARSDPILRCSALLSAALLQGELRSDPAAALLAVEKAKLSAGTELACKERAESILVTLSAFRPSATALAPSDAEGAMKQGEPRPRGDASPGLVIPRSSDSGEALRITGVERYGSLDAARIVIQLNRPAPYKVGALDDQSQSPRLFVDIEGAAYKGSKTFDVGGLVSRVRIGVEAKYTRVVLDLNASAYRHVFYMPEPFRLVIDVSKEAPKLHEAAPHGARPIRRVVLDPGHGGHDPGASGPSGLREKDVTLDIAHRAAPLIARELGISALLTRDGDDYVALDERTARANAFQADLFVSIHCNASEDGAGRGVMTFVLDDARDPSAARVAARENESSIEAAAELAGALTRGDGGLSVGRSNHFAELLQRAAIASLTPSYRDIPNAGIKRAGFYVLAGAHMPAVLFETSFISNTAGETRFNTGDFRQKIADAIVNAVRAYRDGL